MACTLDNLGVYCTLVTCQSKFLEELEQNKYAFVFVSSFLFETAKRAISKLEIDVKLVLLAEYGETIAETKSTKTIAMPVHAISIANVLNDIEEKTQYHEAIESAIRFIAPTANVLVVDDIATNLKVAEGLMTPYRMQIDVAQSGKNAIALVKNNKYDIIFMDHMMPEMDGLEAVEKIRALDGDYFKNVPIIALTANAVSGIREMFLQNGFNGFLAKPIETTKLNSTLEEWLPKEKQESYVASTTASDLPVFEIEGVDVKVGVYMTGGNADVYLKTLSIYYKDGLEKIDQVNDAFNRSDLHLYTTYVHALRSASGSIGAAKLSDFAKRLELAGQTEDVDYIASHNDIFITELETLLQNISYVLSAKQKESDEKQSSPENMEEFREKLQELQVALESMDISAIDSTLAILQNMNPSEKLEQIAQSILMCEYDEALAMTEELL
jgi:CheY-like chemotaxis protein